MRRRRPRLVAAAVGSSSSIGIYFWLFLAEPSLALVARSSLGPLVFTSCNGAGCTKIGHLLVSLASLPPCLLSFDLLWCALMFLCPTPSTVGLAWVFSCTQPRNAHRRTLTALALWHLPMWLVAWSCPYITVVACPLLTTPRPCGAPRGRLARHAGARLHSRAQRTWLAHTLPPP